MDVSVDYTAENYTCSDATISAIVLTKYFLYISQQCYQPFIRCKPLQVAQLWPIDLAKLDTYSTNVRRY